MATRKSAKKEEPARLAEFETTLQQLESLVQKLERGDLSLDESLSVYEQGIAMSRSCQQALQAAEQKVSVLSREAIAALESDADGASEQSGEPEDG